MNSKIQTQLSHTLLNLPGWHTRRKIVVIESDDWGSGKKKLNVFIQ